MINLIRLPLEGVSNARELGGYPCLKGFTKYKSFLRTDDLSRLTEKDVQTLLAYGVTSVIDLRSKSELLKLPNPLADRVREVNYINIPLMNDEVASPDFTRLVLDNAEGYLKQAYIDMINNSQRAVYDIFRFIAEQNKGCILFHCTAGKDRTGIIAALLLGLAGVSRADILANYVVSYIYLRENKPFVEGLSSFSRALMYSNIENFEPALDLIEKHYHGYEQYLLTTGLTKSELLTIYQRIVDEVTQN